MFGPAFPLFKAPAWLYRFSSSLLLSLEFPTSLSFWLLLHYAYGCKSHLFRVLVLLSSLWAALLCLWPVRYLPFSCSSPLLKSPPLVRVSQHSECSSKHTLLIYRQDKKSMVRWLCLWIHTLHLLLGSDENKLPPPSMGKWTASRLEFVLISSSIARSLSKLSVGQTLGQFP